MQIRPNNEASNSEFEAFTRLGGINDDEVERIRMEQTELPEIDLDKYSGLIVGGGPSNVSAPEEKKSDDQKRYEKSLNSLLNEVIERDFPYLGACYGLGLIANCAGGEVSKEKFSEDVGPLYIKLTDEGKKDSLLKDLPESFTALGGHKEACQNLPENAVLLASSDNCPVQMIRFGQNVYATQFHPELDVEGIILRINIYKHAGYFPPEDADKLIEVCKSEGKVEVPAKILKRFVDRYRN